LPPACHVSLIVVLFTLPAGHSGKYTAEEKIRIVLEGLRGEIAIPEPCRREGIAPTVYYRWSKAFLDAGKWARSHLRT